MTAVPQHMQALAMANERRYRRASLRAGVAAMNKADGQQRVADLLEAEDPDLGTLEVGALLCWIDRVGPAKVPPMLRAAQVSYGRQVRALTPRQRTALVSHLRGWS